MDNIKIKIGSDLRIDQIQIDTDQVNITFNGIANTSYWLEQSSDFTSWITVDHKIVSESGVVQMSRPKEQTQAFFRLRSQ
ncbi:MAG: hypothetical protein HOI66_21485 [Verrucomicrobia bacterium]|nr:hypothetical protein [Verrucomicrobiota bacterium]